MFIQIKRAIQAINLSKMFIFLFCKITLPPFFVFIYNANYKIYFSEEEEEEEKCLEK